MGAKLKKIIALSLKIIFLLIVFITPLTISQAQENEHQIYLPLVTNNFDPAWHWQEPTMVTLNPNPNTSDPMLMAIDADGFPHIWWDTFYSPRFIYHTHLTAQGWFTPTHVAETLGTSETLYPPVRDNQGNIHLLWHNWLGVGIENDYRLMFASFSNSQWNPEEVVTQSDQNRQGMLHLDSQGGLHATYTGSLFFSVIAHTSRIDTGWTPPDDIDPDHSVSQVWPDMQGGVHLYGDISYPTQHVNYSYWKDGQFLVDVQTTPGDLPYGDSQLDGKNNLHLFRLAQVPIPGGTVNGIYHRCLTNNLTWTEERVLSASQNTKSPLLKASDQVSQVVLVWQESAGNRVHVAIFDECSQTRQVTITLPIENTWELESATISQSPYVFCFLARKLYTSTEFLVQCATIDP